MSRDPYYVVDVFMWPKFGDCSISMSVVEGWSWFRFNKLGLALGTNLKFYTSVTKELKLKVRMFWKLIPVFVEVTGKNLVGGWGAFCPHLIVNRIKSK